MALPTLTRIAELLGGEVSGGQVRAPGPGHSAADRSLSIKLSDDDPDGFVVHSFSGDDPIGCRDHVRRKLGLEARKSGKSRKGKGGAKPWSPIVARFVYRQSDGTPYLRVSRTENKDFFPSNWNGQLWLDGAPEGPKIPYRLPELVAAPPSTPVHLCEGEKDADALAQLGFVATTNSGGAGNWSDDLIEYFRERHVYIHEDNDDAGRKRCQQIARKLDGIAASVRVIRLPGLPAKGDVSDWLKDDPSGARLVKECESAPIWEPSAAPDTVDEDDEDKGTGGSSALLKQKKKQADILIELAGAARLFHTADDVAYASIAINDHQENWPLRSKGFRRWLTHEFYDQTRGAPSSDAMQAALNVIESRAQFDAPQEPVFVRVAGHEGKIYLNLCDELWRAVEIDSEGWRIVDEPPVHFRRASGMLPLPPPETGGSLERDLRPLLNLRSDSDYVLVVAWLLAALNNEGPYPVLALSGEQGTAKSMLTDFLRALVDPNALPLRTMPRSEHDVFIAAINAHVIALDNASGLTDWLSDTLCRLATGGGFSTRQLYTDQDEVLFAAKRPTILNGVVDVVSRPDLADRSILLTLAPIPEQSRKYERETRAEFAERRPRILGALLTAMSHGLKALPGVHLDLKPRMADFARWATACEGALWHEGTFIDAYTANIADSVEVILESDLVAPVLRRFIENRNSFQGPAADLLKALNETISETERKAKGWPKRAHTLSGILRRIAPPLRKVGLEITFGRDKHQRTIKISAPNKVWKSASPASPASSESDVNDLGVTLDDQMSVTPASPSSANGDARGDAPDLTSVTRNHLKNNIDDAGDAGDAVSPTLSGEHVCAQCGLRPPDGQERRYTIQGRTVWLHRECHPFYIRELAAAAVRERQQFISGATT